MKRILAFALFVMISAVALVAQSGHSATLTWTDTQNPAGTTYAVYRATGLCSGSPAFSKVADALTEKTYQDAAVTSGNYCYAVTATSGGVESAQSNSAGAAIPSFAPSQLSIVVQ